MVGSVYRGEARGWREETRVGVESRESSNPCWQPVKSNLPLSFKFPNQLTAWLSRPVELFSFTKINVNVTN